MTSVELAYFIIGYLVYSVIMKGLMNEAVRDDDRILQYILLVIYITTAVFVGWRLLC